GQPAVAHARPRRAAAALGTEVEQPAMLVLELREEEAAAVAEIRIVGLELVAVIAQRQRCLERAGDRHEAAEMVEPPFVAEGVEADARRGALVAVAQRQLGKRRRRD